MQERLIIRDLPLSGCQLHMHTDPTGNVIDRAHLKTYAGEIVRQLSPLEASMADARADALRLPRIDRLR
jgi:hypothetical protein